MKQRYKVADRRDSRALAEFLSQDGPLLLPLLELIESAVGEAVDELIDVDCQESSVFDVVQE
jgi:hypothetical protein